MVHLDIRKGWQALFVCTVTIGLVHVVRGQADHHRAIVAAVGKGRQPGDGLGMFIMLYIGAGLLVGPFVLLFSGNNGK